MMSEFSTKEKSFLHPKLRDAKKITSSECYELGKFPIELIKCIGAHIVYSLHSGRTDLTGDDWGDIFAKVINGEHFASPIGIADVHKDKLAWSLKTVKSTNVFNTSTVRLISGRCSPDYSFGISNPHEDIQRTGQAVLAIWNERINIAYEEFNPVRINVLIRNDSLTEFRIFEENIERYRTTDFIWKENKNGNLEGFNKYSNEKFFTWQPHGSQFTIHTKVPEDAIKFKVQKPPITPMKEVLQLIRFDESWIEIL